MKFFSLFLLAACSASTVSPMVAPRFPIAIDEIERTGAAPALATGGDVRAYQHGLDILSLAAGRYLAVWASSGLPPRGENGDGEWTHDIYARQIPPTSPRAPFALISAPAAQEPASAAAMPNGRFMVTMEDAWQARNTLMQSYAVFDRNMTPVAPYQQLVQDGGHSGHVAATASRFVVFYSEGWVQGGGVDNLGSGDDVWLKTYDADGRARAKRAVSVGEATRDWWPLIAGSDRITALLWQRFVPGSTRAQLLLRLYDPLADRLLSGEIILPFLVKYYTYDIQYLSGVDAFLLYATDADGQGVAMLFSPRGQLLAQASALPPLVREAQPAVQTLMPGLVRVAYPTGREGVSVFEISRTDIAYVQSIKTGYRWQSSGIDGIFTRSRLLFLATSPDGVAEISIRFSASASSAP